MSFYIYILQCADGSYCTGHIDNLEPRIAAHDAWAIPGYTRDRRPLTLVFSESFSTRIEALERERQIKGWTRRKKHALIRGGWALLQMLAKGSSSTGSPRTGLVAPTMGRE